ncbi:MAG: hypothetical protein IPI49_17765 [Myxococcales bacterium]|jgi:hypothetical protein|nr:hypothetical protein [Myxococcales bacterium]
MKKITRTTTTAFESLQQDKFRTLESTELDKVHGGRAATVITLSTITVTPSGSSNDGDDSWSGEDSGGLPPAQSER